MSVVLTLLQILAGLAALVSGIGHLFGWSRLQILAVPARPGLVLRIGLGVIECLAGLWMLAAIAIPFFAFFAATLLAVITGIALIVKVLHRSTGPVLPAVICLLGSVAIGGLQPLGLRVLALPKPDALPIEPVAGFEVVKTYAPGMWFESVKQAADGTLYLAGNQGQDFATNDKSRVQAQIIARAPDGSEKTFFKLPQGSTAGVIAFGPDGTRTIVADARQAIIGATDGGAFSSGDRGAAGTLVALRLSKFN